MSLFKRLMGKQIPPRETDPIVVRGAERHAASVRRPIDQVWAVVSHRSGKLPSSSAVINQIVAHCGISLVPVSQIRTQPARVLYWQTRKLDPDHNKLVKIDPSNAILAVPTINASFLGNGKRVLAEAHERAFGYSAEIDPITFKGTAVVKSVKNAEHDGAMISCPVSTRDPDKIYQRVLNNQVDEKTVLDLRVPVIGKTIPFVYLKYRTIDDRFSNTNDYAEIATPEDVFSDDELKAILRLADEMRMDYGELDVLRDGPGGRVYVIDANNTPSGPPNHLREGQGSIAIRLMAAALVKEFVQTAKA